MIEFILVLFGGGLFGASVYHMALRRIKASKPPRYIISVEDYDEHARAWVQQLKQRPAPEEVVNATRSVLNDAKRRILQQYKVG